MAACHCAWRLDGPHGPRPQVPDAVHGGHAQPVTGALDCLAVACGRRERRELSGDYYVVNYDEDGDTDYRVVETGGQTQWRKIFNF